jgi:hypothetical protein
LALEDDVTKLAFEQSSRALTQQVSSIDQLRTRAGVLIAGGDLASALLGKDAIAAGIKGGPPFGLLAIGFLLYALFALTMLKVLWPRQWVFSLNADVILGALS